MIQQYKAIAGKFGTAYAIVNPTEKEKKIAIEYYLLFDDNGNILLKGGVLEAEILMERTFDSYIKEHIEETLPYMVLRMLVDNHQPDELEDLPEIKFAEKADAIAAVKANYAEYAHRIAENAASEDVKAAFAE